MVLEYFDQRRTEFIDSFHANQRCDQIALRLIAPNRRRRGDRSRVLLGTFKTNGLPKLTPENDDDWNPDDVRNSIRLGCHGIAHLGLRRGDPLLHGLALEFYILRLSDIFFRKICARESLRATGVRTVTIYCHRGLLPRKRKYCTTPKGFHEEPIRSVSGNK